jgi:hypothetical protein
MRWILLASLAVAACRDKGDENLGLTGGGGAVDVAALAQPEELERALQMTGKELDRRLGAHKMEATATLKLEQPGHPVETLDESFLVESDGRGAVHLRHDNGHGYGMEALAIGDDLYSRARYGHFSRHRPEGDELERLRAAAETPAVGYVRLLERFIAVREAGRLDVAGHPGIKLKLSVTAPARPARESEPARRWRETVRPRYLEGEVVLDGRSGAPLAVKLDTAYSFERDGKTLTVTIAYKQTCAPFSSPITPPAEYTTLNRPRPMLDRQILLDGLTGK